MQCRARHAVPLRSRMLGSDISLAQKFAAASAHRGRADERQFLDQRDDLRFEFGIGGGEIPDGLHGESFHDAAFVAQIVEENVESYGALFAGERDTRKDQRGMPADFLLAAAARYGQQFSFEWPQKIRALRGDLFDGVGGAHADDWVIAGKACQEIWEIDRVSEHLSDNFIRAADRAAIAA